MHRWRLDEEAGSDPLDKGGLWIWGLFKEPLYPFMFLQLEVKSPATSSMHTLRVMRDAPTIHVRLHRLAGHRRMPSRASTPQHSPGCFEGGRFIIKRIEARCSHSLRDPQQMCAIRRSYMLQLFVCQQRSWRRVLLWLSARVLRFDIVNCAYTARTEFK